ncbi:MAG: urease accessory protein UreF [Burkholderiales bacterium]|nr:urease accessory protein UreF [Burkholderiales bacterium]
MTLPAPPEAGLPAQPLAPASLLQLIWLASPALPVGGFSYSEVLEAAVDRAGVGSESAASAWLRDQLHLTLARSDLPVLAQAIGAWRDRDLARMQALNDWVLHTRESSELRLQTSPTYPVAFALAASLTTASVHDCLLSYAFGWAENMTQAAVKAVPLGQSSGQRMLAMLAREIPAAVAHALHVPDHARQAFSPMLAILSAQHETQYSRLFRS